MSDQEKGELKPCPFCGECSLSVVDAEIGVGDASVQCNGCDAAVPGFSLAEAVAAWNHRQSDRDASTTGGATSLPGESVTAAPAPPPEPVQGVDLDALENEAKDYIAKGMPFFPIASPGVVLSLIAALRALSPSSGFVMVPREATGAMIAAAKATFGDDDWSVGLVYRAMIAASQGSVTATRSALPLDAVRSEGGDP